MKKLLEKIVTGVITCSGFLTSVIILLIVLFLFSEGFGLFSQKTIEDGYTLVVNKDNPVDELNAEQIKEKLLALTQPADRPEQKPEPLSAREKEIVIGVVKGLTNKQIADRLFLSTHTVITHRRNIAAKLQIHSPAGLTIYAIVNKLVELDDIKDTIHTPSE